MLAIERGQRNLYTMAMSVTERLVVVADEGANTLVGKYFQ